MSKQPDRSAEAGRTSKLADGLELIIEMNRREADDREGNPDEAENWGCVKVARKYLAEYNSPVKE